MDERQGGVIDAGQVGVVQLGQDAALGQQPVVLGLV